MTHRKIVMNLCTSLDGYIEGAEGEIDWCLTDQDYGMTEFLSRIDTIFFGRKSYTQLLEAMPQAFPDKKKVVFSNTLTTVPEDVQIINSDVKEEVQKILNTSGGDIWLFGGAVLSTALLELDLVDEFIISIHPLVLGSGKPLFLPLNTRKNLELHNSVTFSSGLLQVHYVLKRE